MKKPNKIKTPKVRFSKALYAHSLPGQPVKDWQRLDTHLNQVAERTSDFAQKFNSSDWGWNAGILHDFGKASEIFQAYLRRQNHIDDYKYDDTGANRIRHSSAGAALAEEHHQLPLGRILAYLIAGHHAGLPDYDPCDSGMGALKKRLEDGNNNLKHIRNEALELTPALLPLSKLPSYVKKGNFHFWIRMLFSCLVDADFLDTEAFIDSEKAKCRNPTTLIEKLKDALDNHMAGIVANCGNTPLNRARREILEICRNTAKSEPGLFSLTVPTGGGKTLAAMTFALDHAVQHCKNRVIYVIPYTSIIEQTASILTAILGTENVVEHHSNLNPEKETPHTHLASENWDAPVIVTTNVQFFESLYSARPSHCRKLHNLVNSVVILDEAQLVPPNKLSPCVFAVNELINNYRVTLLLSTATQPVLPKLQKPTEIIPGNLNLYKRLQRTKISIPDKLEEKLSWENLVEELQKHEQVLCIVNRRRDCYDLFQLMPEGTTHLSALMCGEHRSKTISIIKDHLKNKEPIRVISTQLVEAGVDIDFPVVYRALAGLDSIVQAAGRCNREGRLKDKAEVVVFIPPKAAPPGLLHKGECTTKELHTLPGFDAYDPKSFTQYFELFYSKINDTGDGFLKNLIPTDTALLDVAFRSTGNKFRLIDDKNQRSVFVRYEKGEQLIEKLRVSGPNRTLLRKLQRFTVNLPLYVAEKMKNEGLLEEVWPGFLAQSFASIYKESIGLDIFRGEFPIEDLTGV